MKPNILQFGQNTFQGEGCPLPLIETGSRSTGGESGTPVLSLQARHAKFQQALRALWRAVEADEDWQLRTNRPNKLPSYCSASPAVSAAEDALNCGNYNLAVERYTAALRMFVRSKTMLSYFLLFCSFEMHQLLIRSSWLEKSPKPGVCPHPKTDNYG